MGLRFYLFILPETVVGERERERGGREMDW